MTSARSIWRDYETDGVPASGLHRPAKQEIRDWGSLVEVFHSGAQIGGGLVFTTAAEAAASLGYAANQLALVVADGVNSGIYQKKGISGAGFWLRVGNLPVSLVRASNTGDGTENAIRATSVILPAAAQDALIIFNAVATTTSTSVTVRFNGGASYTVLTSSGALPPVGAIVSGMLLAGFIEGTNFRLITDLASVAIQIAAEAAKSAAEAAAAGAEVARVAALSYADLAATVGAGDVPTCPSRAIAIASSFIVARTYLVVAGYDAVGDCPLHVYVRAPTEPAHAGKFRSADRFLPNGSSSSADGGWWELTPRETYDVRVFGAKGGATDDWQAIQNAWDYGKLKNCAIFMGGVFQVSLSQTMTMEGGPTVCALKYTGCKVLGIQGLSWIKLMNNQSTDASPKYFNLIGINTPVDGMHFEGLSFDLNGQNNKISPNRDKIDKSVTISISSPAVINWPAHGLTVNTYVKFATTGALPTGIVAGTDYLVHTVLTADTFTITSTPGGAQIATSGTQSGSHKGSCSYPYNFFNCAAIFVSGFNGRLTNAVIRNGTVKNGPGVTAIGLGQSNSASYVLGSNILIENMTVFDCGLDANDHSSIYCWANDVHLRNVTFDASALSNGVRGPLAAWELHGSNNTVDGFKINNYAWGYYHAGNLTSVSRYQKVSNGSMLVSKRGIVVFNETSAEPGMSDLVVENVDIFLADNFEATGVVKRALDFVPSYGKVDRVNLKNLRVRTSDVYAAEGLVVGTLAVGTAISNFSAEDILFDGFAISVRLGIAGGGFCFDTSVKNINAINIRPNAVNPASTYAVIVAGTHGKVSVNGVKGTGGVNHPTYGIALVGTASDLDMDRNEFDADTAFPISNLITVQSRRTGRQACTFFALPTQSTWLIGDFAYNASAAKLSASLGGNTYGYSLEGWTRVTNGTSNILNTDWIERRCLNGL